MTEALEKLQAWFDSQCDGSWEHEFGIKIETLDNPGWSLEVDLKDTAAMSRAFEEINIVRIDDDWVRCWVRKDKFVGYGGTRNLSELLDITASFLLADIETGGL